MDNATKGFRDRVMEAQRVRPIRSDHKEHRWPGDDVLQESLIEVLAIREQAIASAQRAAGLAERAVRDLTAGNMVERNGVLQCTGADLDRMAGEYNVGVRLLTQIGRKAHVYFPELLRVDEVDDIEIKQIVRVWKHENRWFVAMDGEVTHEADTEQRAWDLARSDVIDRLTARMERRRREAINNAGRMVLDHDGHTEGAEGEALGTPGTR